MSLSPMPVFSRLPIPFRLSHTMETISLHRDGLSALCGPSADIENRPGIREDPQDQGAETEKVGPNAHVEPKHGDERTDGADGECRAGQEARVRRSNVAQRQEQEEPRGQGKQNAGSRMYTANEEVGIPFESDDSQEKPGAEEDAGAHAGGQGGPQHAPHHEPPSASGLRALVVERTQ